MAAAKKTAKKATKKASAKKATKKATAKKAATKKSTKKATAKKATKKATAASTGSVVVTSKVKDAIKGQEARMSSDFVDALNAEVNETIARAVRRAKDNNRNTVRPQDL